MLMQIISFLEEQEISLPNVTNVISQNNVHVACIHGIISCILKSYAH